MNRHRISFLVSGAAAIVCDHTGCACSQARLPLLPHRRGRLRKRLSVSGPVDLEVLTHSGDIIVRSGAAGSVVVRGKIYVGDHWLFGNRHADVSDIEQHPPLRQDGNSIHVDYVNAQDIAIDYEITVPADTTVRTRSGSGDQTVEGTRGNADLQSGSGDMRLRQMTGEIHLQTGREMWKRARSQEHCAAAQGAGTLQVEETSSGDIDSAHRIRQHDGSGHSRRIAR